MKNTKEYIPNYHTCLHKEIRNDVEFCHYYDKEIHIILDMHDKKLIEDFGEKLRAKIRSDKECILRHDGFDYIRLIDVDLAIYDVSEL
jgi:hypothetical protein